MMDALGVAGDLRADHACRICLPLRATNAADTIGAEHFDIERADGRAIVRASRISAFNSHWRVHLWLLRAMIALRNPGGKMREQSGHFRVISNFRSLDHTLNRFI